MSEVKTISDLKALVVNSPDLQQAIKDDPKSAAQVIKDVAPVPLPDNWVYRIVVGTLGLAILLVIIAVVILSLASKGSDQGVLTILTAIASGAIGALAGLLAPSPRGN